MGRRRGLGIKAFIVTAGALLATAVFPATAHAGATSCTIWYPDWNCGTGTISANSAKHFVTMHAYAQTADKVTCILYDAHNWVEVGRIVTGGSNYKTVYGLYGTYTMGCYTNYRDGSAGGYIQNGFTM